MKNLFTLLLITLASTVAIAQCAETAGGFGNNTDIPSYNVEGDVIITLNEDGETITLDLGSNFMTAAGPDIRAFFVNSDGLSDEELVDTQIANLDNIQFGLVGDLEGTNQNGAKSFTIDIPSGTVIENFDKIFFYCLEFNQFWDFGTITPFSAASCSILGLDDSGPLQFSMTPNPSSGKLSISGIVLNESEISIFNTLGTKVYQADLATSSTINISNLTSGIYLVSVASEGKKAVRKLIIE